MKDYIKQHGDAILYAFIGGFALSSLWTQFSPPPLPPGASYLVDHAKKFDMDDVTILHDGSIMASPTAVFFWIRWQFGMVSGIRQNDIERIS